MNHIKIVPRIDTRQGTQDGSWLMYAMKLQKGLHVNEHFAEKMRDAEVVKDTRLLGDFTVIYCSGNHDGRERSALASDGVELGVYGRKTPVVCAECADLLVYAEQRRAFCPKDPKPFCSYCDTHCYKPEMREYMREVMRYAGPRSMWHGHAVDSVKHLIQGRRFRKEMATQPSPENQG